MLYCVVQAFPCATKLHAMASMSASGPAGAWKIASARIQVFISEPNKHRSSRGSLRWFAAFMRITTVWLACRICSKDSDLLVAKPLSQLVFPLYTCIVGVNPRPWMLIDTVTDKRLYCFHQIRMSCTNITKYTVRVLDKHPSEKKVFRADTFPLSEPVR